MTDFQKFKAKLLNGSGSHGALGQVMAGPIPTPDEVLQQAAAQIDAIFGGQFHVGIVLANKVRPEDGGMVCRQDADMLSLMLNVMRSMERAKTLGQREKDAIAKAFGIMAAEDDAAKDSEFEKLTLEVSTLRNALGRLAMFATTDMQKQIIKNAMTGGDEGVSTEAVVGYIVDGVFRPTGGGPAIEVGEQGDLFVSWGSADESGRIPISIELDQPNDDLGADEDALRRRIDEVKS